MDLFDWYYKQIVSPGELSTAFEAVDSALRSMVKTLGIYGLAVGGDVVQTAPTPGLSAVVKGPVLAYDDDGERILLSAVNTAVNLAQDENGAATAIYTPNQERYLGIFAKFERELSDPRTDGDGNEVMFARLEGAEVVVAAGAPAPVGAASRAALREGHVLLADVRIVTGQTTVVTANIFTDRTQYLFRASNGSLNLWGRTFPEIVQKLVDRFAQFMRDAEQQFLAFSVASQDTFTAFVQTVNQALATMIKHARDLPFAPNENGSNISASNVQRAIEEVKATIPGPQTTQTAAQTPFDQTWLQGANVQLAVEGVPAFIRGQNNVFTGRNEFRGQSVLFDTRLVGYTDSVVIGQDEHGDEIFQDTHYYHELVYANRQGGLTPRLRDEILPLTPSAPPQAYGAPLEPGPQWVSLTGTLDYTFRPGMLRSANGPRALYRRTLKFPVGARLQELTFGFRGSPGASGGTGASFTATVMRPFSNPIEQSLGTSNVVETGQSGPLQLFPNYVFADLELLTIDLRASQASEGDLLTYLRVKWWDVGPRAGITG